MSQPHPFHPPLTSAGIWHGIRFGITRIVHNSPNGPFGYNHYMFYPGDGGCVPSPWYYYPCLPPYVPEDQVTPTTDQQAPDNDVATPYTATGNSDLDNSLKDLVQAWVHDDSASLARLLPTDGKVVVRVEGDDSYDLEAKDFTELFEDGIKNVDTVSFEIVDTKQLSDTRIEVHAEHHFRDPWGELRMITQAYDLELEANGYKIREFRSSTYR